MKKRVISFLLAMALAVSGVATGGFTTYAEDGGREVDLSYLMTEDAFVGYASVQPRGVYLLNGYSIISENGVGKIGAGGTTTAAMKCDVSINAIVERLYNGKWVRASSWVVSDTNVYTVTTSRLLGVPRDYWYRTRCSHKAGTDYADSSTNPIWID